MAKTMTSRTFKDSGYIYVRESDDETYPVPSQEDWGELSDDEKAALHTFLLELCTDDNELGFLKDGYVFTETIETQQNQSDMGQLRDSGIVSESANNAFSLYNANLDTIEKIHPLARTATATDGTKITNFGGISNKNDNSYDIAFINPNTAEGDFVIFSRGKNITGLTLDFKPGTVTPLPCSYEAQTLDRTGHLAKFLTMPVNFEWNNSYKK